jgi:heptosyltransferase I
MFRTRGRAMVDCGSSPQKQVVKVLIVKLSSLGDVVHTLPGVQDILAAHPGAQIDWVVEKAFAPLLTPLLGAGLQRVIPCELRRWRKSPFSADTRSAWRAFRRELQSQSYDAVIDLQGLAKSALVAWLARPAPGGKRYAMANRTDGSAYEAPTRWVADVAITLPPHSHAVQRGRELVARALGYTPAARPNYGLNRSAAPGGRLQSAPEKIAFVHGSSRADKLWPLEHWVALGRQLNAQGYLITLPHGSDAELAMSQAIAAALSEDVQGELDSSPSSGGRGTGFAGPQAQRPLGGQRTTRSGERGGAVVLPRLPLDELTAQLAQCAGVIGVDSGLSHIAVALDLPHVQIYNFDTAWRTGPLPGDQGEEGARQRSVFAQPCPTVAQVWQAWLACRPRDVHGDGA